jgi:capsular exopolysaccharide synthesis family protein
MQTVNLEKIESYNFRSTEAYNAIRTNIQFCGKDIKIVCITSSIPNEGKTVVSFSLATSMAESGKRVLFIDADLRKSILISRLKADTAVLGLTHYLSGLNGLEEVLCQTNIDNLDIIFTGPIPPNPSDLLDSEMFREMVVSLKDSYDYIIIDTPPLGAVIDSANVAKCCDGVIVVIQANAISYKFAQRIIKQLEKGNCKILGAILNKVELKNNKYYGKYYGNYYKTYTDKQ